MEHYFSALNSGLAEELTPLNATVLLTIYSYESPLTQGEIADRCGLSEQTVNKAIRDLLKFHFHGNPVLLMNNDSQITFSRPI